MNCMMELSSENEKSRNISYDIFKGIAILLVVIGHSPLCANEVKRIIYCFHMPAFFWIYGLAFSETRHSERGFLTKTFLLKKIRRLMVPCFIWGILYMIVSGNGSIRNVLAIAYGSQKSFVYAGSLSSLWFLPCMFLSVIGFEILVMVLEGARYKEVWLTFIAAALACCSPYFPRLPMGYPWSMDVAMMGLAFVIIGFLSKPFEDAQNGSKIYMAGVFLTACFLLLSTYRFNLKFIPGNNVDMAGRNYGNVLLYLLGGFSGIQILIEASKFICRSTSMLAMGLSMLGKITMPVLFLHKPIVRWLCDSFLRIGIQNRIADIAAVTCTVAITVPLSILLVRYMPILAGERKNLDVVTGFKGLFGRRL